MTNRPHFAHIQPLPPLFAAPFAVLWLPPSSIGPLTSQRLNSERILFRAPWTVWGILLEIYRDC